eukprot:jgi/Picre1/28005/NNA_000966.t1
MAQHRAKAVSLRYLAAKAAASLEEVYTHMQSSAQISLTDAIAKGMERFQEQLTCAGVVTGAAMSPTLNSSWSQTDPGRSPLSTSVMVRRIAALEGDVMVTSDDPTPDDESLPSHRTMHGCLLIMNLSQQKMRSIAEYLDHFISIK